MKPANRRWYRDGQLEREQETDTASRMPDGVICSPDPGRFVLAAPELLDYVNEKLANLLHVYGWTKREDERWQCRLHGGEVEP